MAGVPKVEVVVAHDERATLRVGDASYDLAVLTLGHPERLDDVVAGYGAEVDLEVIRAWWSWRCLVAVRWLAEHGFGPLEQMPEVAMLRADP